MRIASVMLLFTRSRQAVLLLPGALGLAALLSIVPIEYSVNPFNFQVGVFLAGLCPLAAGIVWAVLVPTPMPELEDSVPASRLQALRLLWIFFGTLVFATSGVIVFAIRGLGEWMIPLHLRNTLMAMGVGTLSGCWLPKQAAWIPVGAYLGACWLAGTTDIEGTPQFWAIPCYAADSVSAVVVAMVIFAVSGLCYVLRPSGSRG